MADGGLYADKDEIMGVQSDGTTIISMKYKGGILLGADSRSSNVSDHAAVQSYFPRQLHRFDLTMFLGAGHVHRRQMFGQAGANPQPHLLPKVPLLSHSFSFSNSFLSDRELRRTLRPLRGT